MVKKAVLESIVGSLGLPKGVASALLKAGPKGNLYGVWVASWDLRTPVGPDSTGKFRDKRHAEQHSEALATRIWVWQHLKFTVGAQQHHESFWVLPMTVGKENRERLQRAHMSIAKSAGTDSATAILDWRPLKDAEVVPFFVRELFKAADARLALAGLIGTRFSVFPLVTEAGFEKEIQDTFRTGIVDDLGRLTTSYDEVNRSFIEVQEIEDTEKKAGLLKPLVKSAKRLATKLSAYIRAISHNKEAIDALTPEERAHIDGQVDSLKRNIPAISGESIE